MKELEKLSHHEKELLFCIPALVSLLEANTDGTFDKDELKKAKEITYIKSFSCVDILKPFYEEVEKEFDQTIQKLDNHFPKGKKERDQAIKQKLSESESVLSKLSTTYSNALHHSLAKYTEQIPRAHKNLLSSFLFPLNIKGFSD